ncbi:MAG: ATP-binding cassette domain-containing protein, partial [Clostridia bacterium]
EATGLGRKGALLPMDFHIRQGELLGLAGLLGSGRTELARLLFGADKADSGAITMQGKPRHFHVPRDAIAADIGFCSEDRKHEGAILSLSVRENIILALQARTGLLRAIPFKRQQALADEYVKALGIKTASIETPIGSLSGGNQQKALLARWLVTSPAMLILDEPMNGLDNQGVSDMRSLFLELKARGKTILLASHNREDIETLCDQVYEMDAGVLTRVR